MLFSLQVDEERNGPTSDEEEEEGFDLVVIIGEDVGE